MIAAGLIFTALACIVNTANIVMVARARKQRRERNGAK